MPVQYGGDTTSERRATVEDRIGADRLVQLFDRDGDGVITGADLTRLESYLAQADDVVTGLLVKRAWSEQQITDGLRFDRQVINAWSGIFAQIAGEQNTEWLNAEGKGVYDALGVRGRAELGALARGETRSAQESIVGANATLGGRVTDYAFEFAPDPRIRGDRGRGSF